jgi:transcriptional regulator with XRE-family HTH domain
MVEKHMVQQEYNRIKVALAEARRTNKELAEHLEVKPETVSRWCTNDSQPSVATLYAIARYLNVKVCSLLTENSL